MTTRVDSRWVTMVVCVSAVAAMKPDLVDAADGNKACGLLSPPEIESVLGAKITLNGGAQKTAGRAELCTGQTSTTTVMLRLVTGLDSGRDQSGGSERKGIELAKQMGAQVDAKTMGPITCSTVVPPANLAHLGFNTTCTINKATAVAGIEVQAKNRKDMISIEQLLPLAEKMAGRF